MEGPAYHLRRDAARMARMEVKETYLSLVSGTSCGCDKPVSGPINFFLSSAFFVFFVCFLFWFLITKAVCLKAAACENSHV